MVLFYYLWNKLIWSSPRDCTISSSRKDKHVALKRRYLAWIEEKKRSIETKLGRKTTKLNKSNIYFFLISTK